MSAFLCSDSHITALAVYATRKRIGHGRPGTPPTTLEVGEMLHAANVASVNYRYQEDDTDTFTLCRWAQSQRFSPVQIIKAVQCLRYQSCEHPEWKTSAASQLLDQIIVYAIGDLDGYDAAEWEIRPPVVKVR